LKSNQGSKEWLDFFAVTSSAFAYIEKTPLVPSYEKLTRKDTFLEVASAEKNLGVFNKMRSFAKAAQIINKKPLGKSSYYHLIILNSETKKVEVKSYRRDQLKKATKDYAKIEKSITSGQRLDAVLVAAGPLQSLKSAYPNYFLDAGGFIKEVQGIVNKYKPVF
jgi:hypothetical protein